MCLLVRHMLHQRIRGLTIQPILPRPAPAKAHWQKAVLAASAALLHLALATPNTLGVTAERMPEQMAVPRAAAAADQQAQPEPELQGQAAGLAALLGLAAAAVLTLPMALAQLPPKALWAVLERIPPPALEDRAELRWLRLELARWGLAAAEVRPAEQAIDITGQSAIRLTFGLMV